MSGKRSRDHVRRNKAGGLDPLSRIFPVYAAYQIDPDYRRWRPIRSFKAGQIAALELLGVIEPIAMEGEAWIYGYRYVACSPSGHSPSALGEATALAAAKSTTGEPLTRRDKQELDRYAAWDWRV